MSEQPACFGDITKVFPENADGLRESPPECLACGHKTDCLRRALATPEGAVVDRGGQTEKKGVKKAVKGLRRWSALKSARQNRKTPGK